MAIKWSPGCRCCGPVGCDEFAIGFTPTTEQDREGYPGWTHFTEYLQGDQFSHFSNADGLTYLFTSPMTLFSGSGWTAFEESRYTRVRRVDVANEIDEWHMYGSGWAQLTEEEVDTFLRGGKLAQGMGYVSKQDVLPSVDSWRAAFNYQITNRSPKQTELIEPTDFGETQLEVDDPSIFSQADLPIPIYIGEFLQSRELRRVTQVAGNILTIDRPLERTQWLPGTPVFALNTGRTGLRLQFFTNMSLDSFNEPEEYLQTETEWIDQYADPPPIGGEACVSDDSPRSPSRSIYKRVSQSGDSVLDTVYDREPSIICRGSDIDGGNLIGTVETPSALPAMIIPDHPDSLFSCFLVSGSGALDFQQPAELPVEDGDVIQLVALPPTEAASWEVIPASEISITQIYDTNGLAVQNPDPAGDLQGRKVGLYVLKGQTPLEGLDQFRSADIESFGGTSGSRARSIQRMDCPPCSTIGTCPGDSEFSPVPSLVSPITSLLSAFDSLGDNFIYDPVRSAQQFQNIKSRQITLLGQIGDTIVTRTGLYGYKIVRAAAKNWTVTFDGEGFQPDAVVTQAVVISETITFELSGSRGFSTKISATAQIDIGITNPFNLEPPGTLFFRDEEFTKESLEFTVDGCSILFPRTQSWKTANRTQVTALPLVSAFGGRVEISPGQGCAFVFDSSYDHDASSGWRNNPNLHIPYGGAPDPWINHAIGKPWTIATG